MNYTVHQLQVFLQVAGLQSVTKAAEALHLTQPAISIQLKNFESQFPEPLTEIIGRKLYLTTLGKEVVPLAQAALQSLQALDIRSSEEEHMLKGKLNLSIVSTGKYVMPYFLQSFLEANPLVELNMDVTNKARVIDSLEKNEVDFSLVSILPDRLSIEKISLMPNKLFLVGPYHHKWDTKQTLKALTHLPLIYREMGSGTRLTMEKFLEKRKFNTDKKIALSTNEAVKQAIIANLGYSIMPLIGIKHELKQKDIRIIPFPGLPVSTTWNLIWLKGKKHTKVATAFLQHLRAEKNSIIEQHFAWTNNY
ncbi:MAG: LysR family transcriptional regulator [Chitinophagaceae bacterium]|nr:LysR family transcriptional regulator [Chitinophagaceae bacterium]